MDQATHFIIRRVSSGEWKVILERLHQDPTIGAKRGRDLVAKARWQQLPKAARKSGPSLGGVKRPGPFYRPGTAALAVIRQFPRMAKSKLVIKQTDIKLARRIRGNQA